MHTADLEATHLYKKHTVLSLISAFLLLAATLSAPVSKAAALFTFETQSQHDTANNAWLTDISFNENTSALSGVLSDVHYSAVPDYPYSETADSFADDVDYFCSLYSLEQGAASSGYVYLVDVLNGNSNLISANVSDTFVRDYFKGLGISYPSNPTDDEKVMAQALYTALVTGSYGASNLSGKALGDVLVDYLSTLSGLDSASIKKWLPDGSAGSVSDYILATMKLTLWSAGYDIDVDTSSDETYRLVAVMTLNKLGISTDVNASLESIKTSYIAALLGKKYGVTLSNSTLNDALNSSDKKNDVAFCVLSAIGRKNGVVVDKDSMTLSQAFELVAMKTDVFDLEDDEFYADVYEYDVKLTGKRSSIWIMPKAYLTDDKNVSVSIMANGENIKNNYYTEVYLDTSKTVEELIITVQAVVDGKVTVCDYVFNIHQGTEGENTTSTKNSEITDAVEGLVSSSQSIIAGIFSTFGVSSEVDNIMNVFMLAVPDSVKSVVSFITPTFNATDTSSGDILSDTDTSADDSAVDTAQSKTDKQTVCVAILDKIGSVVDTEIAGIDGVIYNVSDSLSKDRFSLVSFDK